MSDINPSNLEQYLEQARDLYRRVADECREACTVMFTDVTASTSFFERHGDFNGLMLVREYNRMMTPIITEHGGSVVKTLGDGLLVIFPSPDKACAAAVAMQRSAEEVNLNLSGGAKITITVAIHAGDIFRYNNDVFGDVVNVTSRVSGLTNPSTILVTEPVTSALDKADFVTSFAIDAPLKGKTGTFRLFHLHWRREDLARLQGPAGDKKVRAFISTVTPHADAQKRFVEAFSHRLSLLGVEPVQLKQNGYDKNDPIGKTAHQIAACDIVIVLGLERSHAYFSKDKELSPDETEEVHRKYTSSWLHLEAGLAHALGKQIFVVCSADILSDGIFDRKHNSYPVHEFTSHSATDASLDPFFAALDEWIADHKPAEAIAPSQDTH